MRHISSTSSLVRGWKPTVRSAFSMISLTAWLWSPWKVGRGVLAAGWEVVSLDGQLPRVLDGGGGALLWYVEGGLEAATVCSSLLIASAMSLCRLVESSSKSACLLFMGSRSSFICVTTTSDIFLMSSSLSCARFSKRVFVCWSINFLRSSKDMFLLST